METARSPPDWRWESRVVRGSFSLLSVSLVNDTEGVGRSMSLPEFDTNLNSPLIEIVVFVNPDFTSAADLFHIS